MRQRVPQNLCRVEDGPFDTRADEMRWSASGSRQHDATVAAAEAAAHDLLERYVTAPAIRPGKFCDCADHRPRPAGLDTRVGAARRVTQGRSERPLAVAVRAVAAILCCDNRLDD